MAKNKGKKKARAEPNKKRSAAVGFLTTDCGWETLCVQGYTSLAHNPEIITAVNRIATLISSMTIHLMANTDKGDVRLKTNFPEKLTLTHTDMERDKHLYTQS